MEIQPTGGALGAYVTGVDLETPQSNEITRAIRDAWLEHLVLVFPNQPVSEAAFLAFATTLGQPARYPVRHRTQRVPRDHRGQEART